DKKSAMKHCPGPPPYTGDDDGKLRLAVFGVILAVAFTIPVVTYIYLRLARKPFKWSPVFQIYSGCCAGMALYGAVQLFRARQAVKRLAGSDFMDDLWGS